MEDLKNKYRNNFVRFSGYIGGNKVSYVGDDILITGYVNENSLLNAIFTVSQCLDDLSHAVIMEHDTIKKFKEDKEKLLGLFNMSCDEFNEMRDNISKDLLLLMNTIISINNPNKADIGSASGEFCNINGCDYQIQIILVPNKSDWVSEDRLFSSDDVFELVNNADIN